VGKAFGLKVKGQHKDAKINSCIKIYEKLKLYYKELLSNDKIKKIILDFRKEFGCNSKKLSDTKILDFLIWANEQLRNKSMKKILKTKNGIILKDYIGYLMTGCNDKLLEFIKERGGSPKIFMKIINKEFLRALKRKDVIINMPKNRKIFMEWQWRKKRFKEPAEFVIHCINEYNKISKINPKKSR
jgi:hypothetical protein